MTSYDVLKILIDKRYPDNAYASFFEVNEGTGWKRGRAADLVVMSLWPSRGQHLIGHEVKVSRSDWKKELDNPAKADPIFRFCREWYLVVHDRKIVHEGELPETWGLIEAGPAGRVAVVKTAPILLNAEPPTLGFFASLCRAAQNNSALAAYKAEYLSEISKARSEGYESGKQTGLDTAETFQEDAKKWRKLKNYFCHRWEDLTVEEAIKGLKWFYSRPGAFREAARKSLEKFKSAETEAQFGRQRVEQILAELDEEEQQLLEENADLATG